MTTKLLELRVEADAYDDIAQAVGEAVVEEVQAKYPVLDDVDVRCSRVDLDANTGDAEVVVSLPMSETEGISALAEAAPEAGLAGRGNAE